MAISASDVKRLRETTGAGMMACKNALKETDGDFDGAVDYLRKKGLAAAQKKQSRIAAEGVVSAITEGAIGVVVEVNCETDFVSKGEDFHGFTNKIANHILKNKPATTEELMGQTLDQSGTVSEAVNELTLKCGEKVDIRRFQIMEMEGNGLVGSYNHGGKIGVLVGLTHSGSDSAALVELSKDLAMHVAAADPKFLTADDIDEDFKKKEAEIYAGQLKEEGKPENMIEKIIVGKLNKLASEVCLLNQKFVKDPDLTITKLVEGKAKEIGATITISQFSKLNLGEGIEKKEDNLADEVAKLTGQK